MIDAVEPLHLSELRQDIRVPRSIWEVWLETWDWSWHQVARNEFPEPFRELDEFQLACICADRVLWAQCFLREPEDPDHKDPYNIFRYQETSLRYPGAAIHKDGAEVGKTREIVAFASHAAYTIRNGSSLIGAPMQSHLDEIIEAMDDQCTWNSDLGDGRWHKRHRDGWKKHPHHAFYYSNGSKIDFKPAGDKGVAFRGVHARTCAILDEAAKLKNKPQWSEFWRSLKPGCVPRIYSVPDGDRSCDFFKLGQRSVRTPDQEGKIEGRLTDHDELQRRMLLSLFRIQKKRIQGSRDIPMPAIDELHGAKTTTPAPPYQGGEPAESTDAPVVNPDSFKEASNYVKKIQFKLFHWPKWIMPAPYWSAERRQFYLDQYNGEDSPEYKHNVDGEDGDPESSVWPWEQFRYAVKEIPEYRCLKIMVNSGHNEVSVHGYRCEFVPGDDGAVARDIALIDTVYNKGTFFSSDADESDFRKLIKSFFQYVPGQKRGGADFGYSGDPTEILVKNIIGKRKRVVARLQLKHVTYDQQCQALDALDDLYNPADITWGTDYGNAGSAVAHDLQGLPQYEHKNYDDRLKGFQFESTTDNIDEDGEAIIDAKDEKPIKITLKELATDHITKKMQRMNLEYPPDPDIIVGYPNHTVSHAGKHRIYKKKDDHIIDADRAETLAEILGVEQEEGFASGSNLR